jgi:flagellar motor switch protein FliM
MLHQRLSVWLRAAGELTAAKGVQHLPFRIEMALQGIETAVPQEALAHLPEAAIGYRIAFAGEPASMLFAWPRPLALALVNGALGETPTELPADRELSVVEQSLCEYLMQNLAAAVLQETWSGAAPLALTVCEREPAPRWTRLFVMAEQVLQCTFRMRGPFGELDWYWLASQAALHKRLLHAEAAPQTRLEEDMPRKLEVKVRELPVEVTVELGIAELPLAQVAGLAPGDLLLLNQRVSEPLIARVHGHAKFSGWPGRVGSRQALQIGSLRE